jgi:hypothetical protein
MLHKRLIRRYVYPLTCDGILYESTKWVVLLPSGPCCWRELPRPVMPPCYYKQIRMRDISFCLSLLLNLPFFLCSLCLLLLSSTLCLGLINCLNCDVQWLKQKDETEKNTKTNE